ncbi:MAG: class I SAM-dependent methyltransferase [Chloroflexi bacterium]|nr:class I SAM-dependent methyltransferase [Chloroflexota bacterium]
MRERELNVGPFLADQLFNAPRHLLFVLSRYKFAARLLPPLETVDVLELGCGEGFGALMLAERGHRVLGVDADRAAIEIAQKSFGAPNRRFEVADFLGRRFGTFRAVVSLDVIEHIPVELEDAYFRTITSNLGPDGMCIVGTPNETASAYASPQSQAGHVNLYTAERLVAATSRYFQNVFVFGMNDEVVHTGFYPMSHYLFVLGTGKRTMPLEPFSPRD